MARFQLSRCIIAVLIHLNIGTRRPIAGILDLTFGALFDIIYVPILIVMFDKSNFKLSCYKIMAFLGIVDVLALGVNSVITGFLAIQGAVYCTYPNLIYISGMAGLGLWCCSCMIALTLVINRIIDLTKPNIVKFLFGGNRTFLVLTLPIIYGSYFVFFTTPVAFSSKHMTWFFDPMIFKNNRNQYTNFAQVFNNSLVVALTCILYAVLYYVFGKKFECYKASNSKAQTWSSQLIFQSSLICAANQISSVIYLVMNFIEVPLWLIMLGHALWQFGHGAPVLIYLVLNRTIRTGLIKLIKLLEIKRGSRSVAPLIYWKKPRDPHSRSQRNFQSARIFLTKASNPAKNQSII